MVPILYSKRQLKIGITLFLTSIVILFQTAVFMNIDVIEVETSIHTVLINNYDGNFSRIRKYKCESRFYKCAQNSLDDDKTDNVYYRRF